MSQDSSGSEKDPKILDSLDQVSEEEIKEWEKALKEKILDEHGVLNVVLKGIKDHLSAWRNVTSVVTNSLVDTAKMHKERLLESIRDNIILLINSKELPEMTDEQLDLIMQVVEEGYNSLLTLLINASADSIGRFTKWAPAQPTQEQIERVRESFDVMIRATAHAMAQIQHLKEKCLKLSGRLMKLYLKQTKYKVLKILEEIGEPVEASVIANALNESNSSKKRVTELAVRKHLNKLVDEGYVLKITGERPFKYKFIKAPWEELEENGEAE